MVQRMAIKKVPTNASMYVKLMIYKDYVNELEVGFAEETIEKNVVGIQWNRAFATLIKDDGSIICYPTNKVLSIEPLVDRKNFLWPDPLKEVGD